MGRRSLGALVSWWLILFLGMGSLGALVSWWFIVFYGLALRPSLHVGNPFSTLAGSIVRIISLFPKLEKTGVLNY
jgi:hypothetical protein